MLNEKRIVWLARILQMGLAIFLIVLVIFLINNPVNRPYGRILYPLFFLLSVFMLSVMYLLNQLLTLRSQKTSARLRNVQIGSAILLGLYLVSSPMVYVLADQSDAPGILVIYLLGAFFLLLVLLRFKLINFQKYWR
ncbi:hypothetical protein BN85315180 [Paracholeplasma brassicae]|uniref:Uncharacterized protein n=1 Tax=Acholeplasma brassicae TaxID=61635 RepID=U4KTE3_9MOLU|nr:hypothetical protein BN85315180 [Paracholeplasma brassicae]